MIFPYVLYSIIAQYDFHTHLMYYMIYHSGSSFCSQIQQNLGNTGSLSRMRTFSLALQALAYWTKLFLECCGQSLSGGVGSLP